MLHVRAVTGVLSQDQPPNLSDDPIYDRGRIPISANRRDAPPTTSTTEHRRPPTPRRKKRRRVGEAKEEIVQTRQVESSSQNKTII